METITTLFTLAIFAYLSGSIPFGFLLAKTKKIDIRKKGSGNIGATNILRNFGLAYFLLVAILDIAKIALPIFIAQRYGFSDFSISLVALTAITGSMFSIWMNFKGGKAVSAIFATLLCIVGINNFLIFLFFWATLLYLTKIMSLTNLIIVFTIPFMLYYSTNESVTYLTLGAIFIPIIWFSHRENIKRLKQGKETKIIKF